MQWSKSNKKSEPNWPATCCVRMEGGYFPDAIIVSTLQPGDHLLWSAGGGPIALCMHCCDILNTHDVLGSILELAVLTNAM